MKERKEAETSANIIRKTVSVDQAARVLGISQRFADAEGNPERGSGRGLARHRREVESHARVNTN